VPTKVDRSNIYWKDENGQNVRVGRILGRENWTDADWDEDAKRCRANSAAAEARRQALLSRGWELHFRYCSRDQHGEWARDPVSYAHVTHEEAYRLQEEREPGSVPPWPKFENGWSPPTSTKDLIRSEITEIKPMKAPTGLIFYLDYKYGERK
jgi:hypothetical protein